MPVYKSARKDPSRGGLRVVCVGYTACNIPIPHLFLAIILVFIAQNYQNVAYKSVATLFILNSVY